MNELEKTKVVFRIYPNGEVIALFPQIAADIEGYFCSSYMHVGQHGGASTDTVVSNTRPARPEEYAVLNEELENAGYNLIIGKVCTKKDRRIRRFSTL